MTPSQKRLIEFHRAMGQPILPAPAVPSDERVRLRLRLIAEEFFELLEASGHFDGSGHTLIVMARSQVGDWVDHMKVHVDLPELADALGDLDYVVEGTRLEFGIDGEPVAEEIHRANMAKLKGPRRADGKVMKPEGWEPPQIASELAHQRSFPDEAGLGFILAEYPGQEPRQRAVGPVDSRPFPKG